MNLLLRVLPRFHSRDQQNKSTVSLADSVATVHKKLSIFLERFQKVGSQLESAKNAFDGANTSLLGKGSLVGMMGDFKSKGVKVMKALPVND